MHGPRKELEEINDPNHPRRRLSPMGELDMIDMMVERQGMDERHCAFGRDPGTTRRGEPVASPVGREGADPIDGDLFGVDIGAGFLRKIEPVDTK